MIQPLFDGRSVGIISADGLPVDSNKITSIYAALKRLEEGGVDCDNTYGWSEDAYIKTQKGKEWYAEQIKNAGIMGEVKYKMLIAELANYKFKIKDDR